MLPVHRESSRFVRRSVWRTGYRRPPIFGRMSPPHRSRGATAREYGPMIGSHVGHYTLIELLGTGGMGRVFLAEHRLMQTRHAVKVLHAELSMKTSIVQRFINEARAAGGLRHPNV